MPYLDIKIQGLGEDVGFPEIPRDKIVEGKFEKVLVLEAGTEGGATTVAFIAELPDGRFVWMETTAKLVDTMSSIVKGAVARFGK